MLGNDECGTGHYHAYCGKGHWSGEGPQDQKEYEQQGNSDPWADCKDYQQREKEMITFWDKVEKCEHKNLSPGYCEYVRCSTPYCRGDEFHCLDCGAYITECG